MVRGEAEQSVAMGKHGRRAWKACLWQTKMTGRRPTPAAASLSMSCATMWRKGSDSPCRQEPGSGSGSGGSGGASHASQRACQGGTGAAGEQLTRHPRAGGQAAATAGAATAGGGGGAPPSRWRAPHIPATAGAPLGAPWPPRRRASTRGGQATPGPAVGMRGRRRQGEGRARWGRGCGARGGGHARAASRGWQ